MTTCHGGVLVRPARPTLSMWAHRALLNVLVYLWHCAGLGDVAVEYVVHFADPFYPEDEGFAHGAGLLGLDGVGFGHCSPHMFTSGNDHGSAALAAMAPNGNVSSGNAHGSAALDTMAPNGTHGIQWLGRQHVSCLPCS